MKTHTNRHPTPENDVNIVTKPIQYLEFSPLLRSTCAGAPHSLCCNTYTQLLLLADKKGEQVEIDIDFLLSLSPPLVKSPISSRTTMTVEWVEKWKPSPSIVCLKKFLCLFLFTSHSPPLLSRSKKPLQHSHRHEARSTPFFLLVPAIL